MTFPTDKFASVNFELVSDTRTPSARLYRNRNKGSKTPFYMFSLTTPPLPYVEAMEVGAMLDSFQGALEVFTLNNPIPSIKQHNGLYLVSAATKGDTSITIGGFPTNLTKAASVDFIKLEGSPKCYRIKAPADSNSSGQAVVELTQALIQNYPINTLIDYGENVVFQVSMENRDSGDISSRNSKYIVHDVELIEQL